MDLGSASWYTLPIQKYRSDVYSRSGLELIDLNLSDMCPPSYTHTAWKGNMPTLVLVGEEREAQRSDPPQGHTAGPSPPRQVQRQAVSTHEKSLGFLQKPPIRPSGLHSKSSNPTAPGLSKIKV